MQPSPIAETHGPPRPSFLCFIRQLPSRSRDVWRAFLSCRAESRHLLPFSDHNERFLDFAWTDTSSYLSDPNSRRHFFPAMPDGRKFRLTKKPGLEQPGICFPALGFACSNDCRLYSRHAQGEAKR